jgi:hypothetical protein
MFLTSGPSVLHVVVCLDALSQYGRFGVCLVADEVICVVYPDESTRAEWNRISKIMAFDEIVRTDIKKN